MIDCIDKIGQPLNVGDYIAYGHAMGRCAGIRIGKILKISSKPGVRGGTAWSICVIGVDDDWDSWEPCLNSSKGTLQFPDRIIRLDREDVPINYVALLAPVSYDSRIPKIPWSERRRKV
jgi:hypothetical protein